MAGHGTSSPDRAWRPAIVDCSARTLGRTGTPHARPRPSPWNRPILVVDGRMCHRLGCGVLAPPDHSHPGIALERSGGAHGVDLRLGRLTALSCCERRSRLASLHRHRLSVGGLASLGSPSANVHEAVVVFLIRQKQQRREHDLVRSSATVHQITREFGLTPRSKRGPRAGYPARLQALFIIPPRAGHLTVGPASPRTSG
jgi:hypothetical protein